MIDMLIGLAVGSATYAALLLVRPANRWVMGFSGMLRSRRAEDA